MLTILGLVFSPFSYYVNSYSYFRYQFQIISSGKPSLTKLKFCFLGPHFDAGRMGLKTKRVLGFVLDGNQTDEKEVGELIEDCVQETLKGKRAGVLSLPVDLEFLWKTVIWCMSLSGIQELII